jgi:hypothetical protein
LADTSKLIEDDELIDRLLHLASADVREARPSDKADAGALQSGLWKAC